MVVFVMFSGDQLGAESGRRPDTTALGAQLYCFQMGQSDIDTVRANMAALCL